jgi:Ca2+-transporting ATPase
VTIVSQALLLAVATLAALYIKLGQQSGAQGTRHAITLAFVTLGFVQILHAFNTRSRHSSAMTRSLFTSGLLRSAVAVCVMLQVMAVYVAYLQKKLGTVAPEAGDWVVLLVFASAPIVIVELGKPGHLVIGVRGNRA